MLRKTIIALLAVAAVGLLSPTVASARGGFGGHGGFGGFHGGGFHGGGFHGFHGGRGFAFGTALGLGLYAPYAYGAYGYYGDPYAYSGYYDDDGGGCYVVQRRVYTPYGWRLRPVQVCD
jgi:hypothetical protein